MVLALSVLNKFPIWIKVRALVSCVGTMSFNLGGNVSSVMMDARLSVILRLTAMSAHLDSIITL